MVGVESLVLRSLIQKMNTEGWSSCEMEEWFKRDAYKGARRPTHQQISLLQETGECTPAVLKAMDDWLKEGSKAPGEPPSIKPRQHAPKTPTTVPIPAAMLSTHTSGTDKFWTFVKIGAIPKYARLKLTHKINKAACLLTLGPATPPVTLVASSIWVVLTLLYLHALLPLLPVFPGRCRRRS